MKPRRPTSAQPRSPWPPALSLVLVCLLLAGVGYGLLLVLRPIHWRLHAEITHRRGLGLRLPGADAAWQPQLPLQDVQCACKCNQSTNQQPVQQQQSSGQRNAQQAATAAQQLQIQAGTQTTSAEKQQQKQLPAADNHHQHQPPAQQLQQTQQQQASSPGVSSPVDAPAASHAPTSAATAALIATRGPPSLAPVRDVAQLPATTVAATEPSAAAGPSAAAPSSTLLPSPVEEPREAEVVRKHNITLSRGVVQAIAKDGLLFVTFANHHYTQFALTWVHHMRRNNITNFIIGCMDEQILYTLAKRGVYTLSMKSGLPTGDFGWGSPIFAKAQRKKVRLIAMFLKLGVQVALSDIDVMWLRDPTPFYQRYPDADILTSSDELKTFVGKEELLERYPEAGGTFNVGIMLFRSKALPVVELWIRRIEADSKVWEQSAFNDIIRTGQVLQPQDPNHYFLGFNGTLKVGVLPVAWFSNGHVYFVQRLHEKLGTNPYCAHAVYQYSGTPGKMHRFREAMLWREDPDYYTPQGGFLVYDNDVPPHLLAMAGPRTGMVEMNNTLGHWDLVNHQLRQLRYAMALATVLGRTLILPALWCGLDRYWAPHSGTIPGANTTLPFQCPADHVLRLEGAWARQWPEAKFGPHIHYREHSFLANPATPEAIKSGVVVVGPCQAGSPGCADGSQPATVNNATLRLAKELSSDHIKMALSPVRDVRVLRFTNITLAFGNFTRPEDWTKFANRIKHYGDLWCCLATHPPVVHYNLLWDLPHTDVFNRQFNGTWMPLLGP